MKKILYILIFMFGCDSLENQFGVEEIEENFRYYDFLAYGWSQIFENDPELSFSYFDQALSCIDIEHYNNAIVGMGWAKTYQANALLNSDSCIDNPGDCTDEVDSARNKAKCYFYKSTLDEGPNIMGETSDDILVECTDQTIQDYDNFDFMGYSLDKAVNYYTEACNENDQGEVEFIHCFENFILDLKVGYLYLEYLAYMESILDNNIDNIPTLDIILLFDEFLQNNTDYNIMEDKSNYDFDYSFDHTNIRAAIAQLYLHIGDYDNACNYVNHPEIECSGLDCASGDVLDLIGCLETTLN